MNNEEPWRLEPGFRRGQVVAVDYPMMPDHFSLILVTMRETEIQGYFIFCETLKPLRHPAWSTI